MATFAATVYGSTVIQLPSAPIETGSIINIPFCIYSGADRVRLIGVANNRQRPRSRNIKSLLSKSNLNSV